ncbi:hypothetical protein [Sphingobacterium sp. E70]|nr:hypothetical protein [Sphingobacterium sp. E70]
MTTNDAPTMGAAVPLSVIRPEFLSAAQKQQLKREPKTEAT